MLKQSKMMLADGFPSMPDFDAMETGEATKQDVYDTQGIIAYVQKTLKADKAYTAGDSFIYNGDLYTATANIAKDATIAITGESTNATLADGIQEQIDDIKDVIATDAYDLNSYITDVDSDIELTSPTCRVAIINGVKYVRLAFKIVANISAGTNKTLFKIPTAHLVSTAVTFGNMYLDSNSDIATMGGVRLNSPADDNIVVKAKFDSAVTASAGSAVYIRTNWITIV